MTFETASPRSKRGGKRCPWNRITSISYRVAVIGEFKRGKSSLVNCILGTEILPTDILPTMAAVNRIVYSTEQRIEICHKDGTVRTISVG